MIAQRDVLLTRVVRRSVFVGEAPAAAAAAVRTTDDFSAAVIAAIDEGGDTDTVAAVADGLAGAVYGIDAIPGRWAAPLHGRLTAASGRVTYGLDDLRALTVRILPSTATVLRRRLSWR